MTIATRMHRCLIGVAAIALCLPLPALAQTSPEIEAGQTPEIARLRAQVADLTAREQARLAQLELLEQRLRAIEAQTAQMGRPIGDGDAAAMRGAYIVPQRVMLSDEPALSFFRQQDGSGPVPGTVAPSGPAAAGEPASETAERQAPAPTQAVIDVSEQQ